MRLLNDFGEAWPLVVCSGLFACDPTVSDSSIADMPDRPYDGPTSIDDPGDDSNVMLAYEDAEDLRILNDASNLRPPELSEFDYRIMLQRAARDELAANLQGTEFPTRDDVDLLALRWFTQGEGVVVQNHSSHSFGIAAHFTSNDAVASCGATTAWEAVEPSGSALLLSPSGGGCEYQRATVFVRDAYGFFIQSLTVEEAPREAPQ